MALINTWYFTLVATLVGFGTLFSFIRTYDQKITEYMKVPFWEVMRMEWRWILGESVVLTVFAAGLIPMSQTYPLLTIVMTLILLGILFAFGFIRDKERGYIASY